MHDVTAKGRSRLLLILDKAIPRTLGQAMWIHFFTGNHNSHGKATLSDMIQWFEAGLTALGHDVTIGDRLAPGAVNLVWEYFSPGQGQWLRESGVVYGIVGTEIPDGSGFNWRRDGDWSKRWQSFKEAAAGARFIWSMVESAVPDYASFAPTAYMELGFSERLVPYEARWDPEYDFGFFGVITPHREDVLAKIARHYTVRTPAKLLPPGELSAFIARCRIGLCFKQSPEWPIPSPTRLGRLLHAKRGIACEYVPVATRQGSLVPIASPDADFADFCLERLNGPWRRDAEDALERYRNLMPMRQIMERALDETLVGRQWAECPGHQAPDDVRIPAGPLLYRYPDAIPMLESSYRNYNIVRIGPVYVAVAQDLGLIDIPAILSGASARPPEGKFMLGSDSHELVHAIDRALG